MKINGEEKAPLVIENQDFLSIVVDQRLRSQKKASQYSIEERDSVEILSKPKEPLQNEYIDELTLEGIAKPENEIQVVDQMEILKTDKPANEIDYIDDIKILSEEKPRNIIEEIDSIELLSTQKPKSPLVIECKDFLSIIVDQRLRNKKRAEKYEIEGIEPLEILSKPKEPLQTEYIDELVIKGEIKPENEEQSIEQMHILGTKIIKPQNEIEYLDDVVLLSKPKEPLTIESLDYLSIQADQTFTRLGKLQKCSIEERDSVEILSKPKEPLQNEYVDELYIKGIAIPENEIQVIDQMEILKAPKPDNEIDYIDELEILRTEKPANEIEKIDRIKLSAMPIIEEIKIRRFEDEFNIEERDSVQLLSEEKPQLQTEYVDELKINGITKPTNEIQLIDQMEIIKSVPSRPINEIENLDYVELLSAPKDPLIIESQDYLSIQNDQRLFRAKHDDGKKYDIEERDNIKIVGIQKDPLKAEYIDELYIQGYNKPDNEIQLIDQMEILPIERRDLIVQNIDNLLILKDYERLIMKPIWDSLDIQASGGLNLVSHKDLRLERQEIDNFEIIGSIRQTILEQEYINSIEIVERNSILQRHRDSLNIEYMDDLQISPSRNQVRFVSTHAQMPRQNYQIEAVDDIEIMGINQENYEVENIDRISLQDYIIPNRYMQSNEQRDDINIRSSEEYNINYNDNRLRRPIQMNQEYSSEENENILKYREEGYNMNVSQQNQNRSRSGDYGPNDQEKHKTIKKEQYIHEQEHIYDREDWNRNNNIQQINNIFIPQERTSNNSGVRLGYNVEQSYKNSWNEKNRTQGIVNLSVIDDNKKQNWDLDIENDDDMVENRENSDEEPKDEENNQQNIREIRQRQIRQIHKDYDTDEINDIDPLSGLKKHDNKTKYDDYMKSQSQIKYSGKGQESEDEKEKKDIKLPKEKEENLIDEEPKNIKGASKYQPSYMSYMYHHSGKEEEDIKEKKIPQQYISSSQQYMYGPENEGEEQEQDQEDPKDKKQINNYKPGSVTYMYHQSGRDDDEEDVKEKKSPGQFKPTSQNYMVSGTQSQFMGDDKNKKKGQMPYKPTSINYMISNESRREEPKIIVNKPKTQTTYQYKSKEITGMMKKKTKVKNVEYLRELSQSQNFQ